MNIAHTRTKADTAARTSGAAFVRRIAGRMSLCCVLAALGVSAAHAGPDDKERDERAAQSQRERNAQQRQYEARSFEARADEQRRQLQAQQDQHGQSQSEPNRRGGRMTPDERRDLRRQINEAGADLYPRTPRR